MTTLYNRCSISKIPTNNRGILAPTFIISCASNFVSAKIFIPASIYTSAFILDLPKRYIQIKTYKDLPSWS